jgi:bromodomain-containing factor 1
MEPVDPVKLNIPDYFNIVKRPMCFNVIKTKLANNAYDSHSNFVEDMLLVLDNCILYNGTENVVGKAALELKFDLNNMIK